MNESGQSFWENLGGALFDMFLKEYGPGFTLLVVVVIALFYLYHRQHTRVVESLQNEIERLVKERNWYQGVLTDRLTSDQPGASGLKISAPSDLPDKER